MEIVVGLIFVIMAGLGTGTVAWPFKKIKGIHFEQYLFIYILTGLVIIPWIVVLLDAPNLLLIIKNVGLKPLLLSNLLSIIWGTANVLYLICVIKIGAAVTGAILSALGMSVGVTLPMILKGSGLFKNAPDLLSSTGVIIIIALLIIIIGLILVSVAGFEREKYLKIKNDKNTVVRTSGRFITGLVLAILAGIFSAGLSLAFVYSQGPVIESVKLQGGNEITANFTVWALGIMGGALVNILYAAYMMTRKKTWQLLFIRKEELLYGPLVGLQFIVSIIILGKGMLLLGALGASIGFGIQQSLQVIGNQLVGFIGGEWKGINGKPRNLMYLGLTIILLAVCVFAYSNTIY
jgi:L-rhamnose-H+ transport protein